MSLGLLGLLEFGPQLPFLGRIYADNGYPHGQMPSGQRSSQQFELSSQNGLQVEVLSRFSKTADLVKTALQEYLVTCKFYLCMVT